MTWIVGGAGQWHPCIAGDVRVTWKYPRKEVSADCLQKIYPVAPNILAGFAGSVCLGFDVLHTSRQVSNGRAPFE
jgi:ATP-dependent protease HslVU (ClpYQ) peptidase subunit